MSSFMQVIQHKRTPVNVQVTYARSCTPLVFAAITVALSQLSSFLKYNQVQNKDTIIHQYHTV